MQCAYCGTVRQYPADFPNAVYAKCDRCHEAQTSSSAATRGSTAPDARAEHNVSGHEWTEYVAAFERYLSQYGMSTHRFDERVAREWWRQGTEPFEAAKYVANGTKPWATGP